MKALVFTELGVVKMQEVATPVLKDDEVLVKVNRVCVCGSDLSFARFGRADAQIPFGSIFGHEFVGVRQDNGRKVVVNPVVSCGLCQPCREGNPQLCMQRATIGAGSMPGGFAEYVAVPKSRCIPVSDETVPDEKLALVEPLATGLHAVNLALPNDGPVGVIGAGAIGLSIVHSLRKRGVQSIAVADLVEERLAFATSVGASTVGAQLEGDNYDVVYDAVGLESTRLDAINKVRRGGTALCVGLAGMDFKYPKFALIMGEKRVQGSFGYLDGEFVTAMHYAATLDSSWAHAVPFEESESAFMNLLNGKGNPAHIKLQFVFE